LTLANELTPAGTNAPKRKPGRPRKPNPELEALQAKIAELQATIRNERTERREATLEVIPTASETQRPGTYVQSGIDASGTPIMGKVRWNREWIKRTYASVTFTPMRSMRVSPHGVSYDLAADYETTVPQIVKDLYDDVRRQEQDHRIRYRTLSATEDAELAAAANQNPGTKQWSRLYIAGYGLQVKMPEAAPVEQPVVAA
jgi:hypothetical protein